MTVGKTAIGGRNWSPSLAAFGLSAPDKRCDACAPVLLPHCGGHCWCWALAHRDTFTGAGVRHRGQERRVVDGTGNPWFVADVGIKGDTIVAIAPGLNAGGARVDASGLVVSPGSSTSIRTPKKGAKDRT